MSSNDYNLVSTEPIEWAADDLRGFFGYSVHINNGMWPEHIGFPAFTHEQMLECKRINEVMGKRWGFDCYPHIVFDESANTWSEVYDDAGVVDVLESFEVDGIKLYALGSANGWAWGVVDDEHYIYQVA